MKNNKMKYVILGLGILLTVLITASFFSLQLFLRDKTTVVSSQQQKTSIPETVQTLVFIEKIDDYALKGLDLDQDKAIMKELRGMQARDKNGNKMPLSQLKAGQIVIIENEVITPSPDVHTINNLTGVKINLEKMIAQVGNTSHRLAEELLAVDADGKHISLTDLSPYDIVSLNIYEDKVWSIRREKKAARLVLKDVPKDNGQIAIDNSRLIQLKDAKGEIPITAGEHKIVLKMIGYVPMSIHIFVEADELYTLSLKDAQIAYTIIQPQLNVSDYTITIANETYGPNDEIKLPRGQHTATIQSAGYKTWQGKLDLSKDIYLLRVNMISLNTVNEDELPLEEIEIPSMDEETTDFLADSISLSTSSSTSSSSNTLSTSTQVNNTLTNSSSNTLSTSTNSDSPATDSSSDALNTSMNSDSPTTSSTSDSSNTSTDSASDSSSSLNSSTNSSTIDVVPSTTPNTERTITLSTSPSGADIYQGETLIGTSPYTLHLPDGTHEFTIRKDGYSPYNAKVTLDSTDEGGIYLYKLKIAEEATEQ